MPVAGILIHTHGCLNGIIIIPVLNQTGIHHFIRMLINDCTVPIEKIHGVFSLIVNHLY